MVYSTPLTGIQMTTITNNNQIIYESLELKFKNKIQETLSLDNPRAFK